VSRFSLQGRFFNARHTGNNPMSLVRRFPPDESGVVGQFVTGDCGFYQVARQRMGGAKWPMIWIQGTSPADNAVSGVQAFLLDGESLQRVIQNGEIVGSFWSSEDADCCFLAGVLPLNKGANRGEQAKSTLQQIEAALEKVGMTFRDVVRTWFFLDALSDWYGEFNEVRTHFLAERDLLSGLIPASTGIGGANPFGAALIGGALAIRPRAGSVEICEVESPLQCSAKAYRSSFSRAVEIGCPDRRILLVSGTASIGHDGDSLFLNDARMQIYRTLDVIDSIFRSRGFKWSNSSRAIAYFTDADHIEIFEACCRERHLLPLPIVYVNAEICRPELLFELEIDACIEKKS